MNLLLTQAVAKDDVCVLSNVKFGSLYQTPCIFVKGIVIMYILRCFKAHENVATSVWCTFRFFGCVCAPARYSADRNSGVLKGKTRTASERREEFVGGQRQTQKCWCIKADKKRVSTLLMQSVFNASALIPDTSKQSR